MRLGVIGVGGAGGRIADQLLYHDPAGRAFSRDRVLVVDTDQVALDGLARVPMDRRIVLGELHPRVEAGGVEGMVSGAVEVLREELDEVRRAFDGFEPSGLDGVLVVAGLGGGTGCGAGAVMAEETRRLLELPVYVLGVLPADAEGSTAAVNAARGLVTLVPRSESVLGVCNDAWIEAESEGSESGDGSAGMEMEGVYGRVNEAVALRMARLFGVGEYDGPVLPECGLDTGDLMRTLAPGGVSSVGYAGVDLDRPPSGVRGLVGRWLGGASEDGAADAAQVRELVRRAAEGPLTLPCDPASAERVALFLSGPPAYFSRKGFEYARSWLEEYADTPEILAGDDPRPNSSRLEAVVVFGNVTRVPRIKALQRTAVATAPQPDAFEWADHIIE